MSFYVLTRQNFQKRTISLQGRLGEYTESSFNHYPGVYTGLAIIAAIAAYAFLLLFPVLVLVALKNVYYVLTGETADWVLMVIWLTIGLLAAYISYGLLRVKIVPPFGLPLMKAEAPALFRLIGQATGSFGRPAIHGVIITGDYELDIRKVPHCFLPVWSSNLLVIGLPVLQCHTAEHFACMVNRRVGQFSRRYNLVTNWLYQLRSTWPMYHFSSANQGVGGAIQGWPFSSFYVRLYCFLSTVSARKEELNADGYAMEVYNDEVVREMISADAVYRYYLRNHYWPSVQKILAISSKTKLKPYAIMSAAVQNKLDKHEISDILLQLEQQETTWQDERPSLLKRITNIGHESPFLKSFRGDVAAEIYLGESAGLVTEEIERRWFEAKIHPLD